MAIYAKLRVPEVWRLDGGALTFHVLGADGKYTAATVSRSFPFVTPADLLGFLEAPRGRQRHPHHPPVPRLGLPYRQGETPSQPS